MSTVDFVCDAPWTPSDWEALRREILGRPRRRALHVLVFFQDGSRRPPLLLRDIATTDQVREIVDPARKKWLHFASVARDHTHVHAPWVYDSYSSLDTAQRFPKRIDDLVNAAWVLSKPLRRVRALYVYDASLQNAFGHPVLVEEGMHSVDGPTMARHAFGGRGTYSYQYVPGGSPKLVYSGDDIQEMVARCVFDMHDDGDAWAEECRRAWYVENHLRHSVTLAAGDYGTVRVDDRGDHGVMSFPSTTIGKQWGNLRVFRAPSRRVSQHEYRHLWVLDEWLLAAAIARDEIDHLLELQRARSCPHPAEAWCSKLARHRLVEHRVRARALGHHHHHDRAGVLRGPVLRPDQRCVVLDMLRRESSPSLSMERLVYVDILRSDDESHVLAYSPLAGDHPFALRAVDAPPQLYGGMVVARMGWGKTVATLALIASSPRRGATLIVCPAAVLGQWTGMCKDMTSLTYAVHAGAKRQREGDPTTDVVFVSYDIFKHHAEKWLETVEWTRVVFDECHTMGDKSKSIDRSAALKTTIRWGLTATPSSPTSPSIAGQVKALTCSDAVGDVEFMELFAVVPPPDATEDTYVVVEDTRDLTMPESLKNTYDTLANQMAERGWTPGDSTLAANRLHKVAAGFHGVRCPACPDANTKRKVSSDAVYYDAEGECAICMSAFEDPTATLCNHAFCRACILTALRRRGTCPLCRDPCHVRHLRRVVTTATAEDREDEEPTPDIDEYRVRETVSLISSAAADDTFLVFSQYPDMLRLLCEALTTAGIEGVFLRNKVSPAQRDSMVRAFGDGRCRVLAMTTRWGNAGLNLTAANRVVFMERPVSDTVRRQAIGRAARTGQTRDVRVTTLIETMSGV